jgi:hypothetical protein
VYRGIKLKNVFSVYHLGTRGTPGLISERKKIQPTYKRHLHQRTSLRPFSKTVPSPMRGLIAVALAIVGRFDPCHSFARFNAYVPNGTDKSPRRKEALRPPELGIGTLR